MVGVHICGGIRTDPIMETASKLAVMIKSLYAVNEDRIEKKQLRIESLFAEMDDGAL